MDIYSKDFYLFVIQIDHLSGESIGQVIQTFYELGASNVQVLSSITKKNRPSHVIIIDCKKQYAEDMEQAIAKELQVGGWHKITTEHRYLHNEILLYEIVIQNGETVDPYKIEAKHFIGGGIRPEHDSIIKMRQYIKEKYHCNIDYYTLYSFALAAITDAASTVLILDQRT